MINFKQLQEFLKSEPDFRLRQIKQLVFRDVIDDWGQASVLPLALRQRLAKTAGLGIEAKLFVSQKDNSIKALMSLADGLSIEAVLMQHENRHTVCVSSQVGCPLACGFCATGQSGFKRNLTDWEIVEQVLLFARYLKNLSSSQDRRLVTNVVFMGMGEPFLNYDNVLSVIRILNDKEGFGLGARHFSISTVGIVEGIKKLAEEPLQVNLAISLHAPNDILRSQLMPINKTYPLAEVLKAVDFYINTTRRRVMFEYIMIKDVNDGEKEARELACLLKGVLCFVNLIACNANGGYQATPDKKINDFSQILMSAGIRVTKRWRYGDDIRAACGQLAAKVANHQKSC